MPIINISQAMDLLPAFHSRHIPVEHLDLDAPMGKEVVQNGLCDTLEPDVLRRLRAHGVELIETRLAWWDLEPEPGRFDWGRIERDLGKIEAGGMRVGLFPWPQHPPAWYDVSAREHARYRCLEHDASSTILSPWDPKTLEVYDRVLGVIAARLGDRLDMVYVAVSGDYGEVSTVTGVRHYRFSPPHGHWGFWSGDVRARASFRDYLRERYASIAELSDAWETRLDGWDDDLMPRMPFVQNPLRRRHDFMTWYTDSIAVFADRVGALYRHHFPEKKLSIPIGHPNEHLGLGQIKSRAVKTAARYAMTARWTGCGYLLSFPKTNVLARRIASAAHFYAAPFGTEAALIVEEENAANALYEGLANGASQIHDDPQNLFRASSVHERLRPRMLVDPPDAPVAVFYPLESEMLQTPDFDVEAFYERCASLRFRADYDLCDSWMIDDGFLQRKRDLLLLTSCHLPRATAEALIAFARAGGRVWIAKNAGVHVLFAETTLQEMARQGGANISPLPDAPGFHLFDDWPTLEPYASLAAEAKEPGEAFWTLHKNHISRFSPRDRNVMIRPRERGE